VIDIENRIFNEIYNAVIAEYPNAKIESTLNLDPAEFPFVSVAETDNSTLTSTIDSNSYENHATLAYDVNVYSNKRAGRKAEAKAIFNIVDNVLIEWGFARLLVNPYTQDDSTKYRIMARYGAVVSKNGIIYRR
jgi:hypothetical protein